MFAKLGVYIREHDTEGGREASQERNIRALFSRDNVSKYCAARSQNLPQLKGTLNGRKRSNRPRARKRIENDTVIGVLLRAANEMTPIAIVNTKHAGHKPLCLAKIETRVSNPSNHGIELNNIKGINLNTRTQNMLWPSESPATNH